MKTKPNLFSLFSGIFIAVGLLLYMTGYTVRENEYALIYTFGKPSPPKEEAGLYWKLPWPIQKVLKFDRSIQIFDGTFEETYTGDGKNIILVAYVCWRIEDPLIYSTRTGGDPAKAEIDIKDLVRTYKNGVLGKHPLKHLVSTDPEDMKFNAIEQEILDPVKREAKKYGIDVLQIGIKRIALPESTTAVVFAKMRAERQRIADAYSADGERVAQEIRSKADRDAEQALARARAKAKAIRGEGDAEAAAYYKKMSEEPELSSFLRKLESLKKLMDGTTTVILTTKNKPFDLLDKLPTIPKDFPKRK